MTTALLRTLVAMCVPALLHAQAECRRPAARQFTQGEVIRLTETAKFPCRLQFVNTPIALQGDASAAISDFGRYAAHGPDGKFYTTSKTGELYVWSATGQFIRAFGKMGGGPGEFVGGATSVDFLRDGKVYVGDRARYSIFTPALEFVGTITSPAFSNGTFHTGFMNPDGQFVASGAAVVRTGSAFAVFDFAQRTDGPPNQINAFGTPVERSPRTITPSAATNFWAAPPDGMGQGYTLELWRTDGTLLRTIKRDVPWFSNATRESKTPPAEIEIINDDGAGILFVSVMAPNAAKFSALGTRPDSAAMNAAIDIYFEAIDGNAGVVLAAWGPFHPDVAVKTLPSGLFPRSRLGYRRDENADGFGVLRIVEIKLAAQ